MQTLNRHVFVAVSRMGLQEERLQVKAFWEGARADAVFYERICRAIREEGYNAVVDIAKADGFMFSAEVLREALFELSETEWEVERARRDIESWKEEEREYLDSLRREGGW